MLKPFPFRLAEFLIAAAIAIAVFISWRANRRDRTQLAADLAAANQSLAQATARQHDRDAQLQQTLASLAAAKRTATTPAQILRDLPTRLPLPIPVTLPTADGSPSECSGRGPSRAPFAAAPHSSNQATDSIARLCSSGTPSVPEDLDSTQPNAKSASHKFKDTGASAQPIADVALPLADLRPIYDFALDCQACQAKLAAAQSDLADERAKSATLTRERNEAVRTAKGGSTLRRIARAAKWFALGAAAGAIAATAHH